MSLTVEQTPPWTLSLMILAQIQPVEFVSVDACYALVAGFFAQPFYLVYTVLYECLPEPVDIQYFSFNPPCYLSES